ncbi:MAG: anti-sigma factor antagonist [Cyanobacteria bacterium P01_G01_bin.49]
MDINIKNYQDTIIVDIAGDIDGQTSSIVQEKLLPLLIPQSKIILNLSEVIYMSSAGLRVLLNLYKQAVAQESRLILVGLSEEVKDIMEITGFLKFFIISNTVDIALKELNVTPNE